MIDANDIYLDTRLLVTPRLHELLEALEREVPAKMTILPEPYHMLVEVASANGEESPYAASALAYMADHPDRYQIQKQAEPFCGDSLLSVCMQKSGSGRVAVISNNMQLCVDIGGNCKAGTAAGNLMLYRFEEGTVVPLEERLQSVRDKFIYEARSKQVIVDSAAFTEAGFGRRIKLLGIGRALLRESLYCHAVQDTLDRLAQSPAAQEVQELLNDKILSPVSMAVPEQDFIKSLRFNRSGEYVVLTARAQCGRYAVDDVMTEPNPAVRFGELQENGEIAALSPEDGASPAQSRSAKKSAEERPSAGERPHQYLKPQMEWAVGAGNMEDVLRKVDMGANLCWPVVAAARKKLWFAADELVEYASKKAAELYVDGYAGLVNLLLRTAEEDVALKICTLLRKVRTVTPDNLGLAPSWDKLKLLFHETRMERLKDEVRAILSDEGIEVEKPASAVPAAADAAKAPACGRDGSLGKAVLNLLTGKGLGKKDAGLTEEALLLQEAREQFEMNNLDVASEKAWTAANRQYFPALQFLACEIKNPAACCALGRAYQNGVRLNRNDVQDPNGEKQIPPNLELGFSYLKKSADAKYDNGRLQTAICYHHGKGVEKDLSKAESYYKEAAKCHLPGIAGAAAKGLVELYVGAVPTSGLTVEELAKRFGSSPFKLIAALLPMGIYANPATILAPQQALELIYKLFFPYRPSPGKD